MEPGLRMRGSCDSLTACLRGVAVVAGVARGPGLLGRQGLGPERGADNDSCDSLYDSLLTAYLEVRVYSE